MCNPFLSLSLPPWASDEASTQIPSLIIPRADRKRRRRKGRRRPKRERRGEEEEEEEEKKPILLSFFWKEKVKYSRNVDF